MTTTNNESILDLAKRDPMDPRVPAWLSVQAQAAQILRCNHCPDSILELDVAHRERGYDFDRFICPTCKTSFPEASPIITRQLVTR